MTGDDSKLQVSSFYDELAESYHLLFDDWQASIEKQASALTDVLHKLQIEPGQRVLDAACGIGTQTLGLAERGFDMFASDVSAGAVARLRDELAKRALHANVVIDDLRTLRNAPPSLDAVIACDNSIPHLLCDDDISQCFQAAFARLRDGGVFLISVRDYETIKRRSPDVRPYGFRELASGKFLAVQIWQWNGEHYDLTMYLTREFEDGRCDTTAMRARYYAISITKLCNLMTSAGFQHVSRIDNAFYQPIIVGKKPEAMK